MKRPLRLVALAACTAACNDGGMFGPPAQPTPPSPDAATPLPPMMATPDDTPLEVRFLGVGGFLLSRGQDAIVTAPLYSNPNLLDTTLTGVASEPALVAKFAAAQPLGAVAAVLVGHAHYDHLLDVPTLLPRLAPGALIYGNTTMRNLLSAYFPDRAGRCSTPAPSFSIPRERVIALDAAGDDRVDRRVCPGGGSSPGDWVAIPSTNLRVRALCSAHPPQVGPYHFAEGSVDTEQCDPPSTAAGWKEGQTLAYLIDFLDHGAPAYRVYYQDAPTNAPVGHVPADVLKEKRVDTALLCVGSYDEVDDHPGAILAALSPRYAIGGHWESFFQPQDQPLQPIPFLDVATYRQRSDTIMASSGEAPIMVDGAPQANRSFMPVPGTIFTITRAHP
jgi:L-ascorbate metabolism protein UlaG (beta-lactamase superfamily)